MAHKPNSSLVIIRVAMAVVTSMAATVVIRALAEAAEPVRRRLDVTKWSSSFLITITAKSGRRWGQVLQSSNLVCLVDLVSLVDFVFLVCLVFKFLIYKENGRGKTDE